MGYVDITGSKELFCARSFGDCGAKAPIYRYRDENQLINSYAYSFRPNESIGGYIREFNPICYGWKDSNSSIGKEIPGAKDPTDCAPIPNIRNGQNFANNINEYFKDNLQAITRGIQDFANIDDGKFCDIALRRRL
ncbi:unnamed protein product [Onchocerca flexuosa]|uniref:Astacin n=1 Tax=Onchocerca flexuosa TaxID=387005 RepID=A0A183HIJ8_9BILA|nr:unnamed protein product [Onchocerca flexuosa]